MPDQNTFSLSPDLMEHLKVGNLLFYGAADIGKSTIVEETDDVQQIEQLADLEGQVAEYVALDDIYCLYQEYRSSSDQELKDQFEAILARDHGVCLVTRPRSLDWLFTRTEFADLLDISTITTIARQYSEQEAIEAATDMVIDLSDEEIQDRIDRLEYTYEFDADIFEDYTTFVPHIVLRSSALGDRGGLFPADLQDLSQDGMLTSLRGFAGRFSESIGFSNVTLPSIDEIAAAGSDVGEFLQDYEQVYHDTIQPFLEANQDTIHGATASLVSGLGASAAPIVGPLIVGALLQPDGTAQSRDATAAFFGELLDDDLLPPTRCVLEEEMDVPPMTLQYLRTVTRPEFHAQLTRVLDADIDYIETIATQARTEVEGLQDDLDQLSDRITVIEEFLSRHTQNAVSSPEALETELEKLERQYLQVSGSISIDDLELQNVDIEQRYRDVLTGSRVHVLKGPHGTGKTTVSYQLCQRLATDGYTVCIPRLDRESRSFVRTALDGVQGPVAVYTSYRVGAFSVEDVAQVLFLLDLIDDGTIDKLLIECRDEVFGQLDDEVKTRTANERVESGKAGLWRFKDVFELPQIEEDGIRAIATWVGNVKNDSETVQQQLSAIVDIAKQNPEVAKIAARMVCNGQDLSGIQTEDELIWYDIQNLTSARTDEIESAQRTIMKWLAAARGLSQEELKRVSEIRRDVFDEALENLSRYRQTTEGGTYQLIPDVYQEIIFREECLDQLDRYVEGFCDEELERHLADVALNITICANIPHRESYPGLEQSCLTGAETVLSALVEMDETTRFYWQAVETLSTTDLPIHPSTIASEQLVAGIVDQIDTEANNAYQRRRKVHTTERPEKASLTVFSHLTLNYVLAEEHDTVGDLVEKLIETYRFHDQIRPGTPGMLQYRGERSFEYEMKYVMAWVEASFERIAAHRDIDGVVAESQSLREIVLSYHDEFQYPYPDPSEQSRSLQTTAVFYSQVIAGIAHVENNPTVIASLISRIHADLSQMFEETDIEGTLLQELTREGWLVRAYALFIKSLLYHHRFKLVDSWPATIETHVNDVFTPEDQCQFYKHIVEWAGTRAEMEPRPRWMIWILSHEGILSIATDDGLAFVRYDNHYSLMRSFLAACLGVIRRIDLPEESAQLNDLLEARTDELDENYARIYQAVVEELEVIDEIFHG